MNRLTHTGRDEYDLDSETLERVLELTDGGNPVRFIDMDEPDTAEGVIRGISSTERLAGWRLANQSFFDPPKEPITDALDDRERELTAEPTTPEPDRTPEPVATDGGEVLESESEPDDEPDKPEDTDESETTEPSGQTHPDATALEAGQVLVVSLETGDDEPDVTEYVWPQTEAADLPYVLEIHDDADEPERFEQSKRDLFERVRNDETETRSAEEIAVDAPSTAALGGAN